MQLFHHDHRDASHANRKVYARYELIYTIVDFGAALCFVIGSIMFFSEAWIYAGTWLFLIGSLMFATKPTLRLIREVHLLRAGDTPNPDQPDDNLKADR